MSTTPHTDYRLLPVRPEVYEELMLLTGGQPQAMVSDILTRAIARRHKKGWAVGSKGRAGRVEYDEAHKVFFWSATFASVEFEEGSAPTFEAAKAAIAQAHHLRRTAIVELDSVARDIIAYAARAYKVEVAALRALGRQQHINAARHAAIWLLNYTGAYNLRQIGEMFSGREHSTIIYAIKAYEAVIEAHRRQPDGRVDAILHYAQTRLKPSSRHQEDGPQ